MSTAKKGPAAASGLGIPVQLPDVVVLASDLVQAPVIEASATALPIGRVGQKLLSAHDNVFLAVGWYGISCLYATTLNTPLLKQSLGAAVAYLPWLSGRLEGHKDGSVSVVQNNAGVRFISASTSMSLAQLRAALAPQGGCGAPFLDNPIKALFPPNYPLSEQLKAPGPLAMGAVIHLSGGGSLLMTCLHHGMGDFNCLQALAAHWSTAYNTALTMLSPPGKDKVKGGDGSSAGLLGITPAAIAAAMPAALPGAARELQGCVVDGAVLESYAPRPGDAESAVPLEELEQHALMPRVYAWFLPRLIGRMVYHTVIRGGGMQIRRVRVPAERLAALKSQAMAELAAATKKVAAGAAADAALLPLVQGAGVEWVSSNDALLARLLQVLAALPVRAGLAQALSISVDCRPHLNPPLPRNHLGNLAKEVAYFDLDPAHTSLGMLAAAIRAKILQYPARNYAHNMAHCMALHAAGHPPGSLYYDMLMTHDRSRCCLGPEGVVMTTNWEADYEGVWKFGGELPVEAIGAYGFEGSPNTIILMPSPPPSASVSVSSSGPGGAAASEGAGAAGVGQSRAHGTDMIMVLHTKAWQQLDAAGGLRL